LKANARIGRHAGDQRGEEDPRDDEHSESQPHPAQQGKRQVESAVEQDQRHAEREHELGADRVERDVDDVERRWPEEGSDGHQQEDLRDPQEAGKETRGERRHQNQAQR
jgi:hypothetical protein